MAGAYQRWLISVTAGISYGGHPVTPPPPPRASSRPGSRRQVVMNKGVAPATGAMRGLLVADEEGRYRLEAQE